MMCYKDRAFCNFTDCAQFNLCYRSYTKFVKEDAKKQGLKVELYLEKPSCYKKFKPMRLSERIAKK